MDERVTLRSHLDRSVQDAPNGPAVAAVIEALATASIDLADLIADGPLAGITGRHSGVNSDGDLQKDIDVAADEMMRHALRGNAGCSHSVRGSGTAGNSRCRGAALRRDRSARWIGQSRKQYFGRNDLFDSSARQRHRLYLLRARHGAARRGLCGLRPADHAGAGAQRARRHLHSRQARPGVPADRAALSRSRQARRNSRSTHRTGGTGMVRFAPISTNALPAPTAMAAPISTCAGSARWWLNRFASSSAAACSFIPPMPAPDIARDGCGCCTKPIRWRW